MYRDGSVYRGDWSSGVRSGQCEWHYCNGDVYTGHVTQNMRHGRGVYLSRSGCRYDGEHVDNLYEGVGTCRYGNGDVYEGQWSGGVRHGMGVLTRAIGADRVLISTNWNSDRMSRCHDGKIVSNNTTYIGPVNDNGQPDTTWTSTPSSAVTAALQSRTAEYRCTVSVCGVMTYADGTVYIGQFCGGVRQGVGRTVFRAITPSAVGDNWVFSRPGESVKAPTMCWYEGSWTCDKPVEQCIVTCCYDNGTYRGAACRGARAGDGVYTHADGSSYEGQWRDDRPHGVGMSQ